MSYNATVWKLGEVRQHPNADRVRLTTCAGSQVVVGLGAREGDLGVYFPSDGVLSADLCRANNLYRDKAMNADPSAHPGMFDGNRRVRAQSFRGEKSDGFWVPVAHLEAAGLATAGLEHGFEFDSLDGREVCGKYVNEATLRAASGGGTKKARTARTSVMFKEHYDTPNVARELSRIGRDSVLVCSEKLHGTSARIGHVLVDRKSLTWVERLARWAGARIEQVEWAHLNGSRRVVLEESNGTGHHDPSIRAAAFKLFEGKLRKGETVFCEIVGFEPSGKAIMGGVPVKKREHPELNALYGDAMQYSYGCEPGECAVYVYRITLTTPCGHTVDLPWAAVKERCAELGVNHVPELETVRCSALWPEWGDLGAEIAAMSPPGPPETPAGAAHAAFVSSVVSVMAEEMPRKAFEVALLARLTELADGPSTLDSRHLREGICVRCDDWPGYVGKLKSHSFKVLEGMVKDSGAVDMEEAS